MLSYEDRISKAAQVSGMDRDVLDAIVEQAAERGAKKALESVGLHDEDAGSDIRDLRVLLKSWREAKSTMLQTFVKLSTAAILGALALGSYLKIKGLDL
jgi:hypothetical protein